MRNFTKPILILLFTHLIFSIKAQIVSQASGDWNDPATWVDGTIPLASNDVTINHAVVVTQNGLNSAVCKDLNISSIGSLSCSVVGNLTIGSNPNGGNSSLMVDGSLSMSGDCNVFLRGSVDFGANASWMMTGGIFEIDGNNGGVANSVADGTPLMSLKSTMSKNIVGGTIRFNDPHAVTGNFMIDGAADFIATIEIGTGLDTDTNTPFVFGDNINFTDVNINYIKKSDNMTSFGMGNIVKGNFAMTQGGLLSSSASKFEGNIDCSGGVVIGDVVCSGLPTSVSGGANFTGATLQSSTPLTSGSILLGNNIRVGSLMLYNSIELDGSTLTVVGDISGPGIIIANNGGELKRTIAAGAGTTVFPIGLSATEYAPITISNTTALSNWTVSLSTKPNTPPSITKKVQMQWDITPSVPGTQADINVQWDEANEEAGFNRASSALHHWNGTTWDCITPFASPSTAGTTHTITKTSWSSFSPFAVFSQASLPVELMSFTGNAQQGKALLSWRTASEKNNEGFVVEKSFDGIRFDKIGFVKGNDNSTVTLDYNFLDYNFTQNAYYRLKQMDNDSYFNYSNVISLNTGGGKTKGSMKTYPNPVNDVLMVEAVVYETAQLEIVDAVGRVVFKKNVESGNYQISTENLVKGIYILRLTNNNDISIQKIIKN
jgi:Secretion system C-terminal sorting domain